MIIYSLKFLATIQFIPQANVLCIVTLITPIKSEGVRRKLIPSHTYMYNCLEFENITNLSKVCLTVFFFTQQKILLG